MATPLGIFDVLKMIFILGVVLVCAYYATRLLASKSLGAGGFNAKRFSFLGNSPIGEDKFPTVIHRMMIDRESRFVVVEYNNCDYLIAMTSGAIEVIEKRELSEDEIDKRNQGLKASEEMKFDFGRYFDKFKESHSSKEVDKS